MTNRSGGVRMRSRTASATWCCTCAVTLASGSCAVLGSEPDTRTRDAEFARRDPLPRAALLQLLRSTIADVETVLRNVPPTTLLQKRTIQGSEVDDLQAIFHVTEHFSMHTGQIIMLTKILTATDLRFYDFEAGVPVERWGSGPSGPT